MNTGLCKCGCGNLTPVAKRNRYNLGHIGGEHIPYLRGHKQRGVKRVLTEEWKHRISETRRRRGVASGSKNPNWAGGITRLGMVIRNARLYKDWRRAVYERDNYKCTACGAPGNGKNLHADHIVPLAKILRENLRELLWDVSNGRTLCDVCHKETDTYGWKIWNSYLRKAPRGVALIISESKEVG